MSLASSTNLGLPDAMACETSPGTATDNSRHSLGPHASMWSKSNTLCSREIYREPLGQSNNTLESRCQRPSPAMCRSTQDGETWLMPSGLRDFKSRSTQDLAALQPDSGPALRIGSDSHSMQRRCPIQTGPTDRAEAGNWRAAGALP